MNHVLDDLFHLSGIVDAHLSELKTGYAEFLLLLGGQVLKPEAASTHHPTPLLSVGSHLRLTQAQHSCSIRQLDVLVSSLETGSYFVPNCVHQDVDEKGVAFSRHIALSQKDLVVRTFHNILLQVHGMSDVYIVCHILDG